MNGDRPFSTWMALLLAGMLAAAGYGLWSLSGSISESQEIKYDLAALQDARHGVLNAHEWKRQVSVIISKKIEEFDINPANEGRLKAQIETALYKLIDELEKFLQKEGGQGTWLEKMVKSVAYDVAFDADKFKAQVPAWSLQILEEIDNEENRRELKEYIREKIEELLQMTAEDEDTQVLDYVAEKYACTDRGDCADHMHSSLASLKTKIWQWGGLAIGAVVLMFLTILLIRSVRPRRVAALFMIFGCLLLLYGGLSLPMIDIDARISELSFNVMGEQIRFNDQVLFFQSKSILQVVTLLLEQGDFQTSGVGFLILLFSVIFPLSKMIGSALVLARHRLLQNRFVKFLVLKSGKWSMADVFVVAIFMAYIGFRGIINSQLTQLQRNQTANMITTNEYTTLQIGFLMFTGFCLLSLVLSTLLERQILRKVSATG